MKPLSGMSLPLFASHPLDAMEEKMLVCLPDCSDAPQMESYHRPEETDTLERCRQAANSPTWCCNLLQNDVFRKGGCGTRPKFMGRPFWLEHFAPEWQSQGAEGDIGARHRIPNATEIFTISTHPSVTRSGKGDRTSYLMTPILSRMQPSSGLPNQHIAQAGPVPVQRAEEG